MTDLILSVLGGQKKERPGQIGVQKRDTMFAGEQRGLGRAFKTEEQREPELEGKQCIGTLGREGSGRWRCFMREEAGELNRG